MSEESQLRADIEEFKLNKTIDAFPSKSLRYRDPQTLMLRDIYDVMRRLDKKHFKMLCVLIDDEVERMNEVKGGAWHI